jgi:hypothetical protein
MHETAVGTDKFSKMGEEGDDVMLGDGLDLIDAGDVECGAAALFPDGLGSGMTPSSASASQAYASISNQMRNFVSGDQMATISGRE